ncbi:MAG: hypothetical protein HYR60_05210 [Acidobacteria bacterium]|nr:hypothetical protein [Acidobacteriota bacterium]MBI3472642.1 hypothetical protein [Candidatus Solibacter usitatus]
MRRTICSVALGAAALTAADLPVKQVILYKHGVGFFERSGQLGSGESARLDFKTSEMNDVLKSLTLEERGGGKVTGLRYDSSEPLEQKLREFPFQLGDKQPLSGVLDQLKGARVELRLGADSIAGAIVGGRETPGDDKRPRQEQVTLLVDSGELRTVDLSAVAGIRFADSKLQRQFQDYLAVLVGARSKERRSVYIDSTDAPSRQITASYMIPTPVWKSSYRLIFDKGPQAMLEGWAIVDNTTGEDWTKVRLSLVSGRPISFISQLYEPRYIERPVADLPEERAAAPVVHAGAVAGARAEMARKMPSPPAAPAPMAMQAAMERVEVSSTIDSAAAGRELGELFEYRIPNPVTVRKSESAMLPFLQQKIDARKLLIYSNRNSQHPTNAAELSNNTGKTLDGGPITIFDGGAYGGEALVETLKGGDKRLISYAVDLGTRITTLFDSKGSIVREVHFRRGLLTARTAAVETLTYTIRNVDQKAKTLILEHPARPGYKLLDRKPSETTATSYRFEVKLAPVVEERFAVTEERVYDNTFMVSNLTPEGLFSYTQNKALSEAGRKALERIVDLKRQIAAAEAEARRGEAEAGSLTRDQERLRQNIQSLNQVSGQQQQVQTYARRLAEQEAKLAGLRDRIAEAQQKKAGLESELNAAMEKLEF